MTDGVSTAWEETYLPDGEPFPGQTIRADGWVYRDLPRMSYEMFDLFMDMVGDDNIKFLTFADYGKSKRGQCFISPKGLSNLAEASKTPQEEL